MQFYSTYLAALGLAWFLSHLVKYLVVRIRTGKKADAFFGSGGMPSSHTATIAAVWIVTLLENGWNSGLFGLASVILIIVAYDATTVRRSTGQQRAILMKLAQKANVATGALKESHGHSWPEVIYGGLFGILIGVIVFLVSSSWTW